MKVQAVWLTALLCAGCSAESQSAASSSAKPASVQTQGTAMKFTANNRTFTIIPADTRAAAELAALLPLNLDMRDHAGNEKYADLPRRLSADDQAVRRIETGDVMLWQGDTLVVFYKNFDTPYRYTRLGKIQDTNGLQETLGSGSVKAQLGQ